MYFEKITDLIGNTPLLKLKGTNIFAKLEYFNPLHSVKDRPAYFMIKAAEERGDLLPGGTIIESTSGNTGIGLTYVAKQLGYKVILTMPESMSAERRKLMVLLGAEVVLTDKGKGMVGAVEKAKELLKETTNSYMPNQFENPDNPRAHRETTAREIISDLGEVIPDFLVLTIGSAGTISGLSEVLKKEYPSIKVVGVEPEESPLLSHGIAGPHGIMGIGANFVPPLLSRSMIDEIILVKTEDANNCATFAAREYGTLVGISSGAALFASLKLAKDYPNANIVTLFPDTGERYLSTK
ncbi:MAG: O-acetylserine sulfhydrylase [Firmicutes bacterium ADurb.Bin080]|nr:MAG: O-acetylserine sulfhydrylase [Firmicutes bacterium ADurb.Bin080]